MLRLKEIRSKLNMQQKDICASLNIPQNTYSQYENGKREPDSETLNRIANFFNVSVDYLLGEELDSEEIANARSVTKQLYERQNPDISTIETMLGVNFCTFRSWINGFGDFFNNANGLIKLSELFKVSVDYLLGRTDDINQKPGEENITFDDFTYAMYNESKELTDEDKQALLGMARLLKKKKESQND